MKQRQRRDKDRNYLVYKFRLTLGVWRLGISPEMAEGADARLIYSIKNDE
jgi:hypothetical protein